MAQTFKVTAVSPKTKTWEGKFGPMVDHYVKLEGQESPVVVTKKPDSQPPQVGDELYGNLDMGNKFGPKFKSEAKPFGGGGSSSFGGGGGSKPSYQPKDEKAIQAMWAIGQAVNASGPMPAGVDAPAYANRVFGVAVEMFNMVELVKNNGLEVTDPVATAPAASDAPVTLDALDDIFGKPDEVIQEEVPFP